MLTTEELYEAVDRLPKADKWRLVNRVLRSLEQEQVVISTEEWRKSLKATYGIFADDPIERPDQLPHEERDLIE